MRTTITSKGKEKQVAYVYWDEETIGLDGETVLIGAKEEDEDTVHFFRSFAEFWDWLISLPAQQVNCYAHNGGRFDNRDVIEFLLDRRDISTVRLIPVNSAILLQVVAGKKVIWFYDSYLVIPLPLREFAPTFNLPVSKGEFDFREIARLEDLSPTKRKELEQYLARDVLTLQAGMEAFHCILAGVLKDLGLIDLAPELWERFTIASISFYVLKEYIRRKYKSDVLYNWMTKEQEQFVRQSYAGGRTEPFRLYAENISVYDVNSMYPSVMYRGYYPVGKPRWVDDPAYLMHCIRDSYPTGFIEAEVQAPEGLDPPLLWVKKDGHLLFPTGRFRGVYPLPELRRAFELGYRIKPIRGIIYEDRKRVFEEYVDAIYTRRKMAKAEGNHGLSLVLKLLLNSSYGKFAQKREMIVLTPFEDTDEPACEVINGFAVRKEETYINRDINPSIASYITAYARLRLYDYLLKYRHHLCYCDTDSIFLTGIEDVPTSKELGELSYEGTYERGYFAGAKLYLLISTERELKIKLASKGVPTSALKGMNPRELEDFYTDLIAGQIKEIPLERMAGFREILRRKLARSHHPRFRVVLEQVKKLRRTLEEKRELDGESTHPFTLEE